MTGSSALNALNLNQILQNNIITQYNNIKKDVREEKSLKRERERERERGETIK